MEIQASSYIIIMEIQGSSYIIIMEIQTGLCILLILPLRLYYLGNYVMKRYCSFLYMNNLYQR